MDEDDQYEREHLQRLSADRWPRWMGVPTCARYIDKTEAAIRGLVARGMIPFVKQGERVYFDREVIDAWMTSWGGRVSNDGTGARPVRPQKDSGQATSRSRPRSSGRGND